jgi:hypothetical protein
MYTTLLMPKLPPWPPIIGPSVRVGLSANRARPTAMVNRVKADTQPHPSGGGLMILMATAPSLLHSPMLNP